MSIGKTFGLLALSAVMAAGCTLKPKYLFDGKLGQEHVSFYDINFEHVLEVTKPDGRRIAYFDILKDNRVDVFKVTKSGKTVRYPRNQLEKPSLAVAQEQFDAYLKQMTEIESAKAVVQLR